VQDFSKFVDEMTKGQIALVTESKPNNADILNNTRRGNSKFKEERGNIGKVK
jgi:hypothetical protein